MELDDFYIPSEEKDETADAIAGFIISAFGLLVFAFALYWIVKLV
jgi:hypothetical protein